MKEQARPRALLIEDDEDYRLILRRLCDEESLELDVATEEDEALRMLEAAEYAVIVLDLQVPELDGIALIDRLRQAQPKLLERVVLFAGFSSTAHAAAPEVAAVPKADVDSLRYAIRRAIGASGETN
jgi:CheY-like chemotaxis protein